MLRGGATLNRTVQEHSAECLVHPRWQCSLRYTVSIVALSHIVADLAAMSSIDGRRPDTRATVLASLGVTSMSSARASPVNVWALG